MKFTKKVILFAIILIALGISKVNAANGVVTTDGVRVRKGPSTSSEIVAVLNKNATVQIIEETTDGWYKIKYTATSTFEGYMSKEFVMSDETTTVTQPTPTTEPSAEPSTTPAETPTPVETQTPSPQNELPKENLLGEKKVNNQAKVYILPVITSSVRDEISKDAEVSVQEVAGNFAYIKYNNKSGWIRISLIKDTTNQTTNTQTTTTTTTTNNQATEKKGYVNVSQAIVRKSATTSSEMVTSLKLNSEVTVIGEESDFYKIKINNQEAYIAKRLVSDTQQQTTNRGTSSREEQITTTQAIPETQPVVQAPEVQTLAPQKSAIGEQMAQMAKSYLGYKYVYGGASPSTGFDCSGFVYYICNQLGYSVNRTADNQVNNGVYVDKANLQPGDLVFFSNYKTYTEIGHVGIYIGNNQFVHASTATTGVITSSLNDAEYVKRYVTARRIGA